NCGYPYGDMVATAAGTTSAAETRSTQKDKNWRVQVFRKKRETGHSKHKQKAGTSTGGSRRKGQGDKKNRKARDPSRGFPGRRSLLV
ncbi:hypothetical protein NPIL_324261, partial [Nephila pilipes]